jgi:methylthioribulose-1-phosphate dehydratase
MIKGVRRGGTGKALSYLDTLVVPIIENTPDEEDLKDSMAAAMAEYPDAAGVLVRRHGVYVWGADWEKAKTQTEVRPPCPAPHAHMPNRLCSAWTTSSKSA